MGKILVVDDLGFIRHRLTALLTRQGYSVVAAEDGSRALEFLRQDALIDLVLTDGPMPVLSGLDLLRACQTLQRHNDQGEVAPPHVVLMVTPGNSASHGMNDCYHPQRAVSYGFADVLIKPFSETALYACVRGLQSKESAKPASSPILPAIVAIGSEPPAVPNQPAIEPSHPAVEQLSREQLLSLKQLVDQQMQILNSVKN